MYCAQNNRIYCSDCNKSYIPNNYSNHLKSKGHNINLMKKRCCSCDNDITHSNNYNLTCSMKELSLKSNDGIKTDLSNDKKFQKMIKQRKRILINIETLILMFCYQSFVSYILVIIVIVNRLQKLKQC